MLHQHGNTIYCYKYINEDTLPKIINEHVQRQKYLSVFKYSKVKQIKIVKNIYYVWFHNKQYEFLKVTG